MVNYDGVGSQERACGALEGIVQVEGEEEGPAEPVGRAGPGGQATEGALTLLMAARRSYVGLVTLDATCEIVEANRAAEAGAGVRRGELRGWRFCAAFRKEDCAAGGHTCLFQRALRGQERRATPRLVTLYPGGGQKRTYLIGATPSSGETGGKGGATVTMLDTDLVNNADKRRREMIAAALHDLRHTVSVQTIALELLDGEQMGEGLVREHRVMRSLAGATAHLAAGLDDLLNRMLFDLDAVTMHARATPLRPLLEAVALRVAPALRRKGQEVQVRAPANLVAWADPAALDHAVANLLLNAHTYSVDGDTIVAARCLPDGTTVELTVRDHGPGVPVAERKRIFERYYRGSSVVTTGGAGLGLAIVRSVAEAHRGSAGTRAGRGGAVFWLRLPIQPPAETAP